MSKSAACTQKELTRRPTKLHVEAGHNDEEPTNYESGTANKQAQAKFACACACACLSWAKELVR
jgi:hypothetical protein